jgi:hypothetical protein
MEALHTANKSSSETQLGTCHFLVKNALRVHIKLEEDLPYPGLALPSPNLAIFPQAPFSQR